MDYFKLYAELGKLAGPAGHGDQCRSAIIDHVKKYTDDIRIDPLGSVIVHIHGKGEKILITVPYDIPGFIVNQIDERGFLNITGIGNHIPAMVVSNMVKFENGTLGSINVRKRRITDEVLFENVTFEDVYVDIGAKNRESAERVINVGDMCVYDRAPEKLLGSRILTGCRSSIACCVAAIGAMEKLANSDKDVYIAFVSQGELGSRSYGPVTYGISPARALVINTGKVGPSPRDGIGDGVGLVTMDENVISTPWLLKALKDRAKEEHLMYVNVVSEHVKCAAGEVQLTNDGTSVVGMVIPAKSCRTTAEVIDSNDIKVAEQMISLFVEL